MFFWELGSMTCSQTLCSIWRVTKGPNQDWPLALCDYQTIHEQDYEESDIIHRDYVGESARFYSNDAHRWYFLDYQDVDDVVVFRNTDSRGTSIPCKSKGPQILDSR